MFEMALPHRHRGGEVQIMPKNEATCPYRSTVAGARKWGVGGEIPWRNALHLLSESHARSCFILLCLCFLGWDVSGDALRRGGVAAVRSGERTLFDGRADLACVEWDLQAEDVAEPAGVGKAGAHRSADAGLRQYVGHVGRAVHS